MTTIKDVAKKAGVSTTTVSRVMNNKGNFSKETIDRVYEVMDSLGYQPNEVARTLGKKKSKMIALILPGSEIPAFGQLTSAIEKYIYQRGYKLLLSNSLFDIEKEEECIKMLKNNMIEGIIVGSFSNEMSHFENAEMPIVSIGRKFNENIPAVHSDNKSAGILAVRHLFAKGCKKIIYLTGYMGDLKYDGKYMGFIDICKKLEIENYVYKVTVDMQLECDFFKVINQILMDHPNVDGIFAETDLLAMDCIKTFSSFGYRIPQDIKIIGFGDLYFSKLMNPPLTTIIDDTEKLAFNIVDQIVNQIEKKDNKKRDICIPVSLIERKTT